MAADIVLDGLIDLHIHSAPDIVPRSINDLTAARQAQSAGMRAILIKSHHTLTADRAALVETVLAAEGGQNRRLRVFGGLALYQAVGGLNPAAVELALKMGARQIWFPTRPAGAGNGRVILDEQGGCCLWFTRYWN